MLTFENLERLGRKDFFSHFQKRNNFCLFPNKNAVEKNALLLNNFFIDLVSDWLKLSLDQTVRKLSVNYLLHFTN